MAKRGKKKQESDHRKNARNAIFEGGPLDGKKWWIVYPCPEKLMMDMGREPYYLAEGGTNPLNMCMTPIGLTKRRKLISDDSNRFNFTRRNGNWDCPCRTRQRP